MLEKNRVLTGIEIMAAQIKSRIEQGLTTQAQVDATSTKLNLDLEEWTMFQEIKSLALAQEKLTHSEATTIYAMLGNGPDDFAKLDVAQKVILTKIFQELLGWKISLRNLKTPNRDALRAARG